MRIINRLKVFAFWGVVFLLILILGFGVSISDVFAIAKSLDMYLAAYCIYLLASVALYPILVVIGIVSDVKSGFSLGDMAAIGLPPILWTPYKGLDIRWLFRLKSSGMDARIILDDIRVNTIRFLETAFWWFVVITGVYTIYHQGNNSILQAIEQKGMPGKLIVAGVCIVIYCVLSLIAWHWFRSVTKKWRSETSRTRSHTQSGTKAQRYYERHPKRIPTACRACGGPYPECRSSCNLYDE